jgi:hypothetical protein
MNPTLRIRKGFSSGNEIRRSENLLASSLALDLQIAAYSPSLLVLEFLENFIFLGNIRSLRKTHKLNDALLTPGLCKMRLLRTHLDLGEARNHASTFALQVQPKY